MRPKVCPCDWEVTVESCVGPLPSPFISVVEGEGITWRDLIAVTPPEPWDSGGKV